MPASENGDNFLCSFGFGFALSLTGGERAAVGVEECESLATSTAIAGSPGQVSVFFSGQPSPVPTATVTAFDSVHQVATATVTIPAKATIGMYTVCATLGTSCAATDPRITNGFLVSGNPALTLTAITPNLASQCGSATIAVTGQGTHFAPAGSTVSTFTQGSTWANFGPGVTVNSVQITSPTTANINVTVACLAAAGPQEAIVYTGTEYAVGQFTVVSNNVTITSVTPSSGAQGTNQSVQLHSPTSHWTQSGTVVSFGGGINVGSVTVQDSNDLTVSISISPSASVGSYSITATTGGEVAGIVNGFTVTQAAAPSLVSCSPSSAAQGWTGTFTFVTANTNFGAYPPTFDFGANITVTPQANPSGSTAAPTISSRRSPPSASARRPFRVTA